MLTGAAFPLMLQLVFSASIILFADYSEETALRLVALFGGEFMLIGAYLLFGRQNGSVAYRNKIQNEKKRELGTSELKPLYKTGEYALYKGFIIGFISTIPFIFVEFIQCLAPNTVCEFLLKYAFGWAAYPFAVIEEIPSVGDLSEWLNFIWVVFPVCIHAGAYFWGASLEMKRQKKLAEANEVKGKNRK